MKTDKPERWIDKLRDSVKEKVADYAVEIVVGLCGSLLNGAVWKGYLDTGFYHEGWWQANRAWTLLFIVALIVGMIAALTSTGLIVVSVLEIADVIAFAKIYQNPRFVQGEWPFVGWLLHGLAFALGAALLAGLSGRIWRYFRK